jgi:hypothetical protein
MYMIIRKSLLTSLCQREEFTPLWKRGARGDFPEMCIHYLFNHRKGQRRREDEIVYDKGF